MICLLFLGYEKREAFLRQGIQLFRFRPSFALTSSSFGANRATLDLTEGKPFQDNRIADLPEGYDRRLSRGAHVLVTRFAVMKWSPRTVTTGMDTDFQRKGLRIGLLACLHALQPAIHLMPAEEEADNTTGTVTREANIFDRARQLLPALPRCLRGRGFSLHSVRAAGTAI